MNGRNSTEVQALEERAIRTVWEIVFSIGTTDQEIADSLTRISETANQISELAKHRKSRLERNGK